MVVQFTVEQYGALSIDPDKYSPAARPADSLCMSGSDIGDAAARYPLFAFKSKDWDAAKPTCLVTGGQLRYLPMLSLRASRC